MRRTRRILGLGLVIGILPIAVGLAQQVLGELGIEARPDIASTDANMPLSRKYPAICIGLTVGNNAHSMDEFILKEPLHNGMRQVYELTTRVWEGF